MRRLALVGLVVCACKLGVELEGTLCDAVEPRCGAGYACVEPGDGGAARCFKSSASGGGGGGAEDAGGSTGGGSMGGGDATGGGAMGGGSAGGGSADSGSDAGTDAGTDAGFDAGFDAGTFLFDGGFPMLTAFSYTTVIPATYALAIGRFEAAATPYEDVLAFGMTQSYLITWVPGSITNGNANLGGAIRATTVHRTGGFDAVLIDNAGGSYAIWGGLGQPFSMEYGIAGANMATVADLDGLSNDDVLTVTSTTLALHRAPSYAAEGPYGLTLNCQCALSAFPRSNDRTVVVMSGAQTMIFATFGEDAGLTQALAADGGVPVWAVAAPAGDYVLYNTSAALLMTGINRVPLRLQLTDGSVPPIATTVVTRPFRAGDHKPEFDSVVAISNTLYGVLRTPTGGTLYPFYSAGPISALAIGDLNGDGGLDVAVASGTTIDLIAGGAP